VGLIATVGARLLGAGLVIAVESIPRRKALAREFGADVVVDHTERDAVQAIVDLSGRQGVDAAIEALGSQATLEACRSPRRHEHRCSRWGVGFEVIKKIERSGRCQKARKPEQSGESARPDKAWHQPAPVTAKISRQGAFGPDVEWTG
jgi:threonine dehydrogenase-like Zn-dependent dehydrogenase